jgi:addiction module HigA family antidote
MAYSNSSDPLAPLNLTAAAAWLGVSRQSLSELLNARNSVSAEMAIRLDKAGWGTAETWLAAQTAYDLWQAKQRADTINVKRYLTPDVPAVN